MFLVLPRSLRLSAPALLLAAASTACLAAKPSVGIAPPQHPKPAPDYGKLPLSFESNQGQADPSVQFLSHGSGYSLYLTASGAVLALRNPADSHLASPPAPQPAQDAVRMTLAGDFHPASGQIAGQDPLPGKVNYLLGNRPAAWRTGISNYARVRYSHVYPGIDLVYYGNRQRLEHDFVVAPNADPASILLAFDGMQSMSIERATGDLLLNTPHGQLRLLKPIAYQPSRGRRTPVSCAYQILPHRRVRFSVGAHDRARTLVIDPVLAYSTYLGGGGSLNAGGYGGSNPGFGDQGNGIAVDPTGSAYIVGTAYSTNFPVSTGAFQPLDNAANGGSTVFVTKLNAAGTAVVYSTYLGGTGGDLGYGISIDAAGNAYIAGATYSTDFPITCGAFQTANPSKTPGATAAFVARLNATGDALVYSTYLGGSGNLAKSAFGDVAQAIAVDGSGNAFVAGYTRSANFPTTAAALQPKFAGSAQASNAFIAKLNPTGTALAYSTYLGGAGTGANGDAANSIAIDGAGNAYVAGGTSSANFPVTSGAFQTAYPGNGAAFLAKLDPTGSAAIYSTYLGAGGESAAAISVDNTGAAYVAGNTRSANFPVTPGVLEGSSYGANAAYLSGFVTKFNPDGASLAYSTHLQGQPIAVSALAVDGAGSAYLAGTAATAMAGSFSGFQSTPDALATPSSLGYSAFLVKLNPSATAMNYATLFGGSRNDGALALALDPSGNAYLTGYAGSYDFPTSSGAFQGGNGNGWYGTNAFVGKFAVAAESNQTAYPPVPSQFSAYLVLNAEFIYSFLECGLAPFDAFYADFTIFTNQAGPGLNGYVDVSTGFGDDGTFFPQGPAPQELILSAGAGPNGGYSIDYSDPFWGTAVIGGAATGAPCAPPPAASSALNSNLATSTAFGERLSSPRRPLSPGPEDSHFLPAKFTPPPIPAENLAGIEAASSLAAPACLAPPKLLPLAISLRNTARTYAQSNPSLAYAVAGLQKGDIVAVTPFTPANSASPAGDYPIAAFLSGPDAGKYSVQVEPGTLAVLKAPLYISAKNVAVRYGQTPPQLTAFALTGFVNGDQPSAVSGAPLLTAGVDSTSPVGFYPIHVQTGTLAAQNYYFHTFSSGEGAVGVYKVPLTIRPASFTIHAGDPLPTFTYTLAGFVNGDTQASATTGAPTLTTTAPNNTTPGRYYIVAHPGTLAAPNYSFNQPGASTNGILTILAN